MSGSATAVICGVLCVIVPWFMGNLIDLGGKIAVTLFGLLLIALGLIFSKG